MGNAEGSLGPGVGVGVFVGVAVAVAVTGLLVALFVPRRRLWIRATGTEVEFAGLSRGEDPGLENELKRVVDRVAPRR